MGLFGDKMPSCSFPEHHGEGDSGGFPTLVVVFLVACVAWMIFGWVIHLLLLAVLTSGLILITGFTVYGLIWMHRHMLGSYRPAPPVRAPQYQAPFTQLRQQHQAQLGGQPQYNVNFHFGDMTPAERAETIRQLRGGR